MPKITLRGLTLTVPETALKGGLGRALASGRYEHQEANAILAHLRPGDRFMDLGAGIGFLCALAAGVVGGSAVTGVEAAPGTLALARRNLDANGFPDARLESGAVTGGATGMVEFGQRPAFWASALRGPSAWSPHASVIEVPALPLADLLATHCPTLICCDIEGAELAALATPMTGVRLVVVEVHPTLYGPEGVAEVCSQLEAQGFQPEGLGTKGATLVYRRDMAG